MSKEKEFTLKDLFSGKKGIMASIDKGKTYVNYNSLTDKQKDMVTDYRFGATKKKAEQK